MKPPVRPGRSLSELRDLTPARVGLGRSGAGLPTKALLDFTLDHARARDAVHAAFDVPAVTLGLHDLGLEAFEVASCAQHAANCSGSTRESGASRDFAVGHDLARL